MSKLGHSIPGELDARVQLDCLEQQGPPADGPFAARVSLGARRRDDGPWVVPDRPSAMSVPARGAADARARRPAFVDRASDIATARAHRTHGRPAGRGSARGPGRRRPDDAGCARLHRDPGEAGGPSEEES